MTQSKQQVMLNTTTNSNQKDEALRKLDNAQFGWFHIKACLVSGIGFFTDAYDLFIVQFASVMIGYIYYGDNEENPNHIPKTSETLLKQSALIGTLIGQLVFGYLADVLGRKKMYGAELMIIVVTTIVSCFAAETKTGMSVVQMLMIWRFFLGIGIGGDYPLSAIITSEFANTKNRGAMIAAVFAMQGFGILAGSLVSLLVLVCFKQMIEEDVNNLDYVWRIIIGIGALPGLVAIYYRLTIPETPRYTMEIKGDIIKGQKDVDKIMQENEYESPIREQHKQFNRNRTNLGHYLGRWKNAKILLGTSVAWFALDVGFYGTNLNQSEILKSIGFVGSNTVYDTLYQMITGNLIIALLGTVPGYWLTVLFVDKWGRKTIQIMGFTALTILFMIMGLFRETLPIWLFVSLYTLANLFNNFGPNATTFIIPGEVFPTQFRSTCHGISAASGKLGAIVSQLWFLGIGQAYFATIMIIFSIFMGIGLIFTLLIPETKGKSLEEISQELTSSKIHLLD